MKFTREKTVRKKEEVTVYKRIVAESDSNYYRDRIDYCVLELKPEPTLWKVRVLHWATDHGVCMGPIERGQDITVNGPISTGDQAIRDFDYYVSKRAKNDAEVDGDMFSREIAKKIASNEEIKSRPAEALWDGGE